MESARFSLRWYDTLKKAKISKFYLKIFIAGKGSYFTWY